MTDDKGMTEEELATVLAEEHQDASSYYDSELAEAQTDAMKRFYAEPYGDEVEGRSKAVTHDVQDAINWQMPDYMRTFTRSDELIELEPGCPEDEQFTDDGADYINYILFKDNDGERVIHDFIFDGLLQRAGVAEVEWSDGAPSAPYELEGVTQGQLADYVGDQRYEVLEYEERAIETPEGPQPVFDIKIRKKAQGKVVVENVPPEEFRFHKLAKSARTSDYLARSKEVFMADLIRQFPGKKAELARMSGTDAELVQVRDDMRTHARHTDTSTGFNDLGSEHARKRKVLLHKENIRIDFDGDGVVELRRVQRVGKLILENEIIDRPTFATWSPILVAHKLAGLSIADQTSDLQKIKTVITRRYLDGLDINLNPTVAVDETKIEDDGLDALEEGEIGAILRFRGDPRVAISQIQRPDISIPALQALEYFDNETEERTGVSRQTQGVNKQALADNQSGVALNLLQTSAAARKEMIVGLAAEGLKDICELILHLVCQHQDHARMLRIKKRWVEFDPRRWSDEMTVTIHIGNGALSRDVQVANLSTIAAKQEQILQVAGPSNPIVSMKEYRDTLARLVEAMGYRDPSRFFKEIPDDYQPPQPEQQPDPKALEAQAKAQQMQAEQERKNQETAAEQQRRQAIHDFEMKRRQEQAISDDQRAYEQMVREIELKTKTAGSELDLKRDIMAAELALKREQMDAELKLKEQQIKAGGKPGKSSSTNVGDVRVGGDPG